MKNEPINKSISTQVAELSSKVEVLTEAVRELARIRDNKHETLLARIKEIFNKL
jgi:hypothetical protein